MRAFSRPKDRPPPVANVPPVADSLPFMRFIVAHPGFEKDATERARNKFTIAVRTVLNATMGLARWPHRPEWGPQRVTSVTVTLRPPAKMKATLSHPTIVAVLAVLTGAADAVSKVTIVPVAGKHRTPIGVEIQALTIEDVPDVAERASAAARTETSTPRAALRPGESLPADVYEQMGVRIAPPQDWVERQLEAEETAKARERSVDLNAVTAETLQRETSLDGPSSSSKGRSRANEAPPPTATELNAQFDRETRDLGMIAPASDVERARTAMAESTKRLERPGPGAPLKGRSPRIKIHGRVPADLLVACAPLGPDLESILAATAKALADGVLYVDPKVA